MTDEKESFFELLKKAISPPSPEASGTSESPSFGGYSDTQTHSHTPEGESEKPSDTSPESSA